MNHETITINQVEFSVTIFDSKMELSDGSTVFYSTVEFNEGTLTFGTQAELNDGVFECFGGYITHNENPDMYVTSTVFNDKAEILKALYEKTEEILNSDSK